MKGNQKVIDGLNSLLTKELTSIDLYFLQSRMYDDWGLTKLFERISHERDDEMLHADLLINRILFLGGAPDIATRDGFKVEPSVKSMLQQALDYEMENLKLLKKLIVVMEQEQDYVSRSILVKLLSDTEEDHIDWLETQLGLLEKVGEQNYLQAQMGEKKAP